MTTYTHTHAQPRRTAEGTALEPLAVLERTTTPDTRNTTGHFLQTQAAFLLVALLQYPKPHHQYPWFGGLLELTKKCAESPTTLPSSETRAKLHQQLHAVLLSIGNTQDNSAWLADNKDYILDSVVRTLRDVGREGLASEWIEHAALLMLAKQKALNQMTKLRAEVRAKCEAEEEAAEKEKMERERVAKEELGRLQQMAERRVSEVPSVFVTGPDDEKVEWMEQDRIFVAGTQEGGNRAGATEVAGRIEVEPELRRRLGGLKRGSRVLLEGWGSVEGMVKEEGEEK